MKKILLLFLRCGLIGWCLEICFTSFHSFTKNDFSLKGVTSLWMFPIYGMASFLTPICHLIKNRSFIFRGIVYTICIFIMEFITGRFLSKKGICPWNYTHSKWHIKGIIRLDYAPIWFVTGLFFEHSNLYFLHRIYGNSSID